METREVVAHSHLGFHPDEIGLVFKAPRIHDAERLGQVAGGGPEVEVGMVGGVGWNPRQGRTVPRCSSSRSGSRRHPAWRCCRSATGSATKVAYLPSGDRPRVGGGVVGGVWCALRSRTRSRQR